MSAEQRQHVRVTARWNLTATRLDNSQISGRTSNVSVGGLQFNAVGDFKKGDRLLVNLQAYVNGNTIPLKIIVEITYVAFSSGGTNIGAKIISKSDNYARVIEAYVKQQASR